MCAALKADAYGFGLVPVAKAVFQAGADAVAVADAADAVELRERGITGPILVYAGNLPTNDLVDAAIEFDLLVSIIDEVTAKSFASAAKGRRLPCFIKVDVGLERLGASPAEATALGQAVQSTGSLDLRGVYTHMHVTDDDDVWRYTDWQFARFSAVVSELEAAGIRVPLRMVASSAVLAMTGSMTLNAVDPGHILYGLHPEGPHTVDLDLRSPFRSLSSRLIQVKQSNRSEFREKLPFPGRTGLKIGIIPMGRRDGLQGLHCGHVLVRGRRCALGEPSLEHTRVDLTDIPDAGPGDEVLIIGRQGAEEIGIGMIAEHQHIAPTSVELPLSVGTSVRRSYVTDHGATSQNGGIAPCLTKDDKVGKHGRDQRINGSVGLCGT